MYILQVRNRTQDEVTANLSARETTEREQRFFDDPSGIARNVAEALKALPAERKGKKALVDLLLKVQGSHMKSRLVPLRKKVRLYFLASSLILLGVMNVALLAFTLERLTGDLCCNPSLQP